jgi:NADPH:quinone reductase-like Zn-dependent oxidoreductase
MAMAAKTTNNRRHGQKEQTMLRSHQNGIGTAMDTPDANGLNQFLSVPAAPGQEMQALTYDNFGPLEAMHFALIPAPVPSRGEVAVEVRATSLNVIDSRVRNGQMGPLVKKKFPKIPGADFAGTIAALGEGVTDFSVGDPVFGAADPFKGGAFAPRIVVPASQIARKPESLSFEEAAALPIASLAALSALRDLGLIKPGADVLIHGASGGVGLFAVQLAKHFGARVTAVAGSHALSLLRDFGADTVIDYRSPEATGQLGAMRFGRNFNVIVNASGKLPYRDGRVFLKPSGRFVEPSPTIPLFIGANIANLFRSQKHLMLAAFPKRADLELLAALAVKGVLKVTLARAFPFSQSKDAFSMMERGGTIGKIVVVRPDRSA